MTEQVMRDRIYAGWMGKNIGGTLGGPLEGRMELLDIKGYTQEFVGAMENDDLDLQLVNLHCVEQYGGRADVRLLSREWLAHVHFQFDEYGHALTNMRRGLGQPLSGRYNNFFTDCMGSPIRSEIWAMLCAGMPDLAAYYAYHDASVDHAGGEGVYGEIFFAVLESLAFFETDQQKLITSALSYIPAGCSVRLAVEHLMDCHACGMAWQDARQSLIDRFAGDNFTYAPINIAFTLVGWLYEEGFTAQMLTTLNCGYDTDCTVATLGSLLGILHGTAYLDSYWTEPLGESILVSRPIFGFDPPKTIGELTDRTILARRLLLEHYAQQPDKSAFAIPYESAVEVYHLPEESFKKRDLTVKIRHDGDSPAFAPGETKRVRVELRNHQLIDMRFEVIASAPGFGEARQSLFVAGGACAEAELALTAPLEKMAIYRGQIEIRRFVGGIYWNSEYLPLSLLPTMDWRVDVDGVVREVRCNENRIPLSGLIAPGARALMASTELVVPEDCEVRLCFACANPLKCTLDGEVLFDCGERTVVIPAYHRADPRKCADVQLKAGAHELRLYVGEAESLGELYFMIVEPAFYWAYHIGSTFG